MKIVRDEPQENLDEKDEKPNDNGGIAGTPPLPGNISIKSAMDIRRLLVSVINQLRQKSIDIPTAKAIIYASHELLAIFAQVDLEERIQKLESLTGYGGGRQ
jgi:hypothetical protein